MVAAWGRPGGVGLGAVTYLKEELGATELGEIEPYGFFDLPMPVREGVIQEEELPQSKFYYWENDEGDDLILFIADAEPLHRKYEYVGAILQVAEAFGAKRIYAVCGIAGPGIEPVPPNVYGAVNDAALEELLEHHHVLPLDTVDLSRTMLRDDGTVTREATKRLTSMNALLLGLAGKRGLQGVYLLAEMPYYAMKAANPDSSKAILDVLMMVLDFRIDMSGIDGVVVRKAMAKWKRVTRARLPEARNRAF